MKKNNTLKLVLAALVVVLVSLVSFVGVYKGKNLVKGYSLGKDFGQRKVATFSVVEETESKNDSAEEQATEGETEQNQTAEDNQQTEENQSSEENQPSEGEASSESENSENNESAGETSNNQNETPVPLTEEQKRENYKNAKNSIARRLTAMKAEEYDIRLDEVTGKLVIEVPEYMDSTYLSDIVTKGKVKIKNSDTNEVIVDGDAFKDASAKIDTTTYSKPVIVLNMKFSNNAKNKINGANRTYTDSEGNETESTFEIDLEDSYVYSEKASLFVESVNSGELDLMMGQNDEGEDFETDYQTALAITSIIKCGEIPVEYEIDSIELISPDIRIKTIVIIAIVIGALMFVFALYKFKSKAVLPVLSLIGLVATILLVLRYANVRITAFTVLGIAIVTVINYIIILRTLNNKKSFKENFIKAIDVVIPHIIIAIVFCYAPYLQLASLGMTIFWGLIVMCIYNAIVVRTLIKE